MRNVRQKRPESNMMIKIIGWLPPLNPQNMKQAKKWDTILTATWIVLLITLGFLFIK